jgi:hypothetical protein
MPKLHIKNQRGRSRAAVMSTRAHEHGFLCCAGRGRLGLSLLLMFAAPLAGGQSLAPTPVTRGQLCVTEGAVEQSADGSLAVSTPKMRAFALVPVADIVQAQFRYLGPSVVESPLRSGVLRRQFGLKLRTVDPCNLIYVMWRIAPQSSLVVQVKSNPGQHSSGECTNHGYRTVKPHLAAPLPELLLGEPHALRAELLGTQLRASVDGRTVWQGDLDGAAPMSEGPVGARSDNARIAFTLAVGPGTALSAAQLPACRPGQEASE